MDIPPIANTDIALIWLHKGLYHHMETRSSSDSRPVELTITSCIDYQLNVVRLLSPIAREFMGSVDIQPGKIEISKVLTFGNQAHIQYKLNQFCQMKHFHAQVNHLPGVPTPQQSISNDRIQLSPLSSCVNYDVQLIAYYVPESYSVSRVMRIALPAAHDENKVHLSIEDENLLIEWKARAACQLKKSVINVLRNNEPWKQFDHTGAGPSDRIPLEKQYSTYAVSIKFIYANDFSEMSEIVSIVYGSQTTNSLNLTFDLHPNRMDLLWTGPGLYQPLFYRVDGVYDNGNEITKVVTGHRCTIPLEPGVEYANVIVAAVDANGERKISSHRTAWPKRGDSNSSLFTRSHLVYSHAIRELFHA
ncbi:unnamed protein product [Echinostoma caproni]|uniref:Fibronectin type-III domain-containing protein n=1 Tax=Echinostoma caproni TaxID=27848 RepID=A0A3P8KVV9_9TREM|nr:unnamed protein product [Echinostoma caproni]